MFDRRRGCPVERLGGGCGAMMALVEAARAVWSAWLQQLPLTHRLEGFSELPKGPSCALVCRCCTVG